MGSESNVTHGLSLWKEDGQHEYLIKSIGVDMLSFRGGELWSRYQSLFAFGSGT